MNTENQITVNGLVVTLKREETQRVKEGAEPTIYFTVDVEQLLVSGADGQVDGAKSWANHVKLFGTVAKLQEKLQAKVNQDLAAAQKDAGKDVYDMATKFANVSAYIVGGFGATRSAKQSPLDVINSAYVASIREANKTYGVDGKPNIGQADYDAAIKLASDEMLRAVMDYQVKQLGS